MFITISQTEVNEMEHTIEKNLARESELICEVSNLTAAIEKVCMLMNFYNPISSAGKGKVHSS